MNKEQNSYNKKFAISQSAIKDWEEISPLKWKKTWIDKSIPRSAPGAAAAFGTLVDCLVFTPDRFKKQFEISDIKLPSETIMKIVEGVYNNLKELNKNIQVLNVENKNNITIPHKELKLDYKDVIQKLSLDFEYYTKQPERAYNEVLKNGTTYFDYIVKLDGKKPVTQSDYDKAMKLRDILYTDTSVKGFFKSTRNTETIFQQGIYTNFEVVGFDNIDFIPVKGLLDNIYFNHKKKEVREIDLKVPMDAFNFKDSIKRFRYTRQHSFYDYLLREWLKTYKNGEYKDYTVGNPLNVVIDEHDQIPYIYQYNYNDLVIERTGHEAMHWIKGWEEIIYEIAFHIDTQQWDRPKQHILNGFIPVNQFKR